MDGEVPQTKTFIITFGLISTLFCAIQGSIYLAKYLNVLEFDSNKEDLVDPDLGTYSYDTGCWQGKFSDKELATFRKSEICMNSDGTQDVSCIDEGSNWAFIIAFNTYMYVALTLTFLIITIGACSAWMRSIGGFLYCASGAVFLYSIYQTYQHLIKSDHYSGLCELNLNPSLHQSGILDGIDGVPQTFAEDA